MLYVNSRKSFEVRREKNVYFDVCLNKTHTKAWLCVRKKHTAKRQKETHNKA